MLGWWLLVAYLLLGSCCERLRERAVRFNRDSRIRQLLRTRKREIVCAESIPRSVHSDSRSGAWLPTKSHFSRGQLRVSAICIIFSDRCGIDSANSVPPSRRCSDCQSNCTFCCQGKFSATCELGEFSYTLQYWDCQKSIHTCCCCVFVSDGTWSFTVMAKVSMAQLLCLGIMNAINLTLWANAPSSSAWRTSQDKCPMVCCMDAPQLVAVLAWHVGQNRMFEFILSVHS